MLRFAILLLVSMPAAADNYSSVIARHKPMHPDNTQAVTFVANATKADRVILSYQRFTLNTGPDGTHLKTLVEPEKKVKVCNPPGNISDITCTHTMPRAFPAGSLITYTARAWDLEGMSAETYSFAAGDYPWPDYPIPIRLKGDTLSKLDTVFIPDKDIEVPEFRDQLYKVVDMYLRYEPILTWRGLHNFYYSGQQGKFNGYCSFTDPPNINIIYPMADAIAFLHKTQMRDCTNMPRMASEIDDEKVIIHENAHTLYALHDEYCCNTNYSPQECAPNIYGSLAACEADAPALGYTAADCTQLKYDTTIKNIWRIDPSSAPGCIMGPNQSASHSVFRAACARRLNWRYDKCLGGTCMPSVKCP